MATKRKVRRITICLQCEGKVNKKGKCVECELLHTTTNEYCLVTVTSPGEPEGRLEILSGDEYLDYLRKYSRCNIRLYDIGGKRHLRRNILQKKFKIII